MPEETNLHGHRPAPAHGAPNRFAALIKQFRPKWGAVATAIVIAVLGFTYRAIDDIRKNRLDDVKSQIGTLYGPLCALVSVELYFWEELISKRNLTPSQHSLLTSTLIAPLNDRIEKTIFDSKISIDEQNVRTEVQHFLLWAGYQKTQRNQQSGEAFVDIPKVRYPRDFGRAIENKLDVLHQQETWSADELTGLWPFKSFLPKKSANCTGGNLTEEFLPPVANSASTGG
jgi:hypothetical protein